MIRSDNSDNWNTESNDVVAVDGLGLCGIGCLLFGIILILFGLGSLVLVAPVSAERSTDIETIAKSALHEALKLL